MTTHHTSAQDVRQIQAPTRFSHKWNNGAVLVMGGSHRYHGAPLLAMQTAARFVDMVHFASPENFRNILPRMRGKLMEFIPVFSKELAAYIGHSDVVLMGPGLEVNQKNKRVVNRLLRQFPNKRFILDAGALRLADKRAFQPQHIVTPNPREFLDVFGLLRTPASVRAVAKKFKITVIAKGAKSFIATPSQFAENTIGHPGLTKGGTGDVLAGLIAAFYTKNDAWLSCKAAAYLVGKTSTILARKQSFAYSASDLLEKIPENFGALRKA